MIHNLSMLTFPSAHPTPPPPARTPPAARPVRALKVNLLRRQKLNSLTFLKSPKSSAHASGAWRHSHPPGHIFYLGFLFWHLWMTHPPCARVKPALMLHITNPCAKRKVLSLTKPKSKTYKTKSLGHYITYIYIYIYMDTNIQAATRTHWIHSRKKEKRRRKKEKKNICRVKYLSRIINALIRPRNSGTKLLELIRTTTLW